MGRLPEGLDYKNPTNSSTTPGVDSKLSSYSPSPSSSSSENFQEAEVMADGASSTAANADGQEIVSQEESFAMTSPAAPKSVESEKRAEAITVDYQITQEHLNNGNNGIEVATEDTPARSNEVDDHELNGTCVPHSDCKPRKEDKSAAAEEVEIKVIGIVETNEDSSKVCSRVDTGAEDHKTETSSSDGHSGHTVTPSEMSSFVTEYSVESDRISSQEARDTKVKIHAAEVQKDAKSEVGVNTQSPVDGISSGQVCGSSRGLQDSRWMTPPDEMDSQLRNSNNNVPRPYPHQQYYNAYKDRDDLRRVQTLLVKTQQDLRTQREENRMLKRRLEDQPHEKTNIGLLDLFQEVINKHADLQENKARLARKDLELRTRTAAVNRTIMFLSEGQKQLKNKLEEIGVRPATELQLQLAWAEGEAATKHKYAGIDASLVDRLQKANIRETELDFRQQHWKIDAKDALEAEIRETLRSETHHEISEVVYGQAYQAGKTAGLAEKLEESKQEGFLRGFQAAQNMQGKLSALKKGHISHDSTDLDFIFDFSHPQNPFNLGRQIGSLAPASDTPPPVHRPSFYAEVAAAKESPKYINTNSSSSPAENMNGHADANHVNETPPCVSNVNKPHARVEEVNGYVLCNNNSGSSAPPHHIVEHAMHYFTKTSNQPVNVSVHAGQPQELAKTVKNVPNLMDF